MAVSATIFEIFTLKARKLLNFLTPPFFEAPVRGNQRCKFHNPIFNRFCMIHPSNGQTDGQTDGRAIAYTRYSIYAVARNGKKQDTRYNDKIDFFDKIYDKTIDLYAVIIVTWHRRVTLGNPPAVTGIPVADDIPADLGPTKDVSSESPRSYAA